MRKATPGGWDDREAALIAATQHAIARGPTVTAARLASHWGEHSWGWLATAATGALVDPTRREIWLRAGVAAFTAHAGAVVVKRLVRRPRPCSDAVAVHVGTPSRLSFPSAHAASTTAFALSAAPVIGVPVASLALGAMALSRIVLGVHYPTDVLAGAALGAVAALGTSRLLEGRAR